MMELDVIGACMALGRFGRWGRHLIRLIGIFFSDPKIPTPIPPFSALCKDAGRLMHNSLRFILLGY